MSQIALHINSINPKCIISYSIEQDLEQGSLPFHALLK